MYGCAGRQPARHRRIPAPSGEPNLCPTLGRPGRPGVTSADPTQPKQAVLTWA